MRKECGGEAQRLDREMREEMERDRPLCDVLIRMDTLQYEESRAANERVAGDLSGKGGAPACRGASRVRSWSSASSLPAIAQPILAGSQGRSSGGAGGRDWRPDDDEEEEKKKKRQPISMDR